MRYKWIKTKQNYNYEVNEDGYVRNSRNNRILSNSPNNKGYMTVSLGKHLPGQLVHVLVAEAFIPDYEPGLDVDHINGNKWDNRVENLQWVTRSDNLKRAYAMGLAKPHRSDNAGEAPKKVQIVETGETFPSISACARAINGTKSAVSLCLSGDRNKHKGYHFRQISD